MHGCKKNKNMKLSNSYPNVKRDNEIRLIELVPFFMTIFLRADQTRLNWSSPLSLLTELKFANPWNCWARGLYRPKVHDWWKPLVSTWLLGQGLCDLLHLARTGRCAERASNDWQLGKARGRQPCFCDQRETRKVWAWFSESFARGDLELTSS